MLQSKFKKQPTRTDLAEAWKMIRDQQQIMKLLNDTTHRQDRVLGNVLMAYPRCEELWIN
jgi:hypothetical protein